MNNFCCEKYLYTLNKIPVFDGTLGNCCHVFVTFDYIVISKPQNKQNTTIVSFILVSSVFFLFSYCPLKMEIQRLRTYTIGEKIQFRKSENAKKKYNVRKEIMSLTFIARNFLTTFRTVLLSVMLVQCRMFSSVLYAGNSAHSRFWLY